MEHGEIDLNQKLKELRNNAIMVEENFLRITLQQMLQAVNYIHNERIVHGEQNLCNENLAYVIVLERYLCR